MRFGMSFESVLDILSKQYRNISFAVFLRMIDKKYGSMSEQSGIAELCSGT